MLINLRNALMAGKRLPYDAEVEYLESSGTQWIDTGYAFNSASDKVELVFELLTTTPIYKWIFGAYDASKRLAIGSGDGRNRRTLGYNASTSYNSDAYYTDGAHIFLADSTGASIDGQNFFRFADFSTTSHILLYTIPFNPSGYCSNARIWSYKHYRNGVLVHDYIPVRKKTVGYLYDRVTRKLFGNAGTGDFVVGQDVVPVEYIESHGTEWIDTGFNITNATSFSYDAKFSLASTIANSEPRLFSNEGAGSGACYDIYFVTSTNILSIRQSGTTAQISRRDVPIVSTMDEQGNYRGYYEDEPQSLLYNATRAFVAPTTDRDYRIFSRGNNTSSQFLWQGKLYWLNFTKNGEPSRRYRPVRVGTEGALIDTLTRRIYRNQGTGAFTYGNDLKYPIPA